MYGGLLWFNFTQRPIAIAVWPFQAIFIPQTRRMLMSEHASIALSEGQNMMKAQVRRTAWTAATLAVVLAFWDAILGFVLHLIFYVIEFLELGLEHFLEMLFHLERHEAQMFTAWIGAASFVALGGYVYVWVARSLQSRFQSWSSFFSWMKGKAQENWWVLSLLAAIVLGNFLLF
jgi:hypothetical protein